MSLTFTWTNIKQLFLEKLSFSKEGEFLDPGPPEVSYILTFGLKTYQNDFFKGM